MASAMAAACPAGAPAPTSSRSTSSRSQSSATSTTSRPYTLSRKIADIVLGDRLADPRSSLAAELEKLSGLAETRAPNRWSWWSRMAS